MKKTIITYTNRKNASKVYTFVETINDGTTAVLVDSEGNNHMYAMTTLRKTFKKSVEEVEVEEPKTETKTLTKHQKNALNNIEGAYTYVLGGYENSVQDGQLNEMPSVEDMFEEVYDKAMNSGHELLGGMRMDGGSAPICMKFAGKAFVREQISKMFRADGYEIPEELVAVPERKPGHSNFVDGECTNLHNEDGEKTVEVKAFTGMLIGTFAVVKETATEVVIKTSRGLLRFDTTTGVQLDARNKRFANRIVKNY